jgi:hypothetical protein
VAKIVHARLDEETHQLLRRLRQRTGLTDSDLLRRGLKALAAQSERGRRPRIVGLGKFASGRPDLGSNKAHLKGFGRS